MQCMHSKYGEAPHSVNVESHSVSTGGSENSRVHMANHVNTRKGKTSFREHKPLHINGTRTQGSLLSLKKGELL